MEPGQPVPQPVRGDCLVVQDVLGGELLLGEVRVAGKKVGNHYWNRLPDGTIVDLTADQFCRDEHITGGEVVTRPPDGPRRHRERYELLRARVLTVLSPIS